MSEWVSVYVNMNENTQKYFTKKNFFLGRVAYIIKNDYFVLFAICRNFWIFVVEAQI